MERPGQDGDGVLPVHVEYFVGGLVRVFDHGLWYGDPYRIAFPFKYVDLNTIEGMGLCATPTPSEFKAVVQECRKRDLTLHIQRVTGAMRGRHIVE